MDSVPGVVLVDPPMSGQRNMAIDELLLKNAKQDWPVVLRIYRWEVPTLSLGYFQSIEEVGSLTRLEKLPRVRRKTGGGAIVHDRELTYSILLPRHDGHPIKGHSEALYRAIHLSFVRELRKLGWDANLSETCTCKIADQQNPTPFLCFLRRSPIDLVVGDDKIMGSAQRRSNSGLLQHGSFLLHRAGFTPELPGLLDLGENSMSVELSDWQNFFVATLKSGLDELLHVHWRDGMLSELVEI